MKLLSHSPQGIPSGFGGTERAQARYREERAQFSDADLAP